MSTEPDDTRPPASAVAGEITVRPAVTADARAIRDLVVPYAERRILLAKELVGYYESVQEFLVAVSPDGEVVGCGALHVMWRDLGEVRTLAVREDWLRAGVGRRLVAGLLDRAADLGLDRVFCLTFEVDFFARLGFAPLEGEAVDPEVFAQLLRSHDDGVAEFLDLAHVKQNTLGNTRMIVRLAER